MSEHTQQKLSKQQQKSQETKERIFRAAKEILKKKDMMHFPSKISAKKPVSQMEVFTIILKRKTIFFLTI